MHKRKKIYTDKKGRNYIKQSYFIGGKMKMKRVYVIDGMPADEFYERYASDIDHLQNGDYWLISTERDSFDLSEKTDLPDEEDADELPF